MFLSLLIEFDVYAKEMLINGYKNTWSRLKYFKKIVRVDKDNNESKSCL